MTSAVLEGVLMGLFLSVFVGPVFFLLIETSINKGIREAFIMDAGVILSDIAWIILLWWGIDKYLGFFLKSPLAMVFAGAVFILFGASGFYSKKRSSAVLVRHKNKGLFLQGFFLNSINPSVALFWLATISLVLKQFAHDDNLILFFFISIFVTIVIVDIIKFSAAIRLSRFLNTKRQKRLSIFTSAALIIFGVYMILKSAF